VAAPGTIFPAPAGGTILFTDPNRKDEMYHQYNFTIQDEFRPGWLAEVGYVGSIGRNLLVLQNIGTGNDQGGPGSREVVLTNISSPNPIVATRYRGHSNYNALQSKLEKRFAKGLSMLTSYTWSKTMEALSFLNAGDSRLEEVISGQDRAHRLALTWLYELPFGRGKSMGANTNALVSHVISGWQFQGIYTYQSGFPINGFGNLLFTGNYEDIALPADQRTLAQWFNTDAGFNKVSAQQLGSNVRTFPMRFDFVRGHEVNNFDLSVIKNATVAPGRMLQFRFESLNALNHALFPSPSGNSLTPTAVQFGSIVSSTQLNYARRTQVTVKFIF